MRVLIETGVEISVTKSEAAGMVYLIGLEIESQAEARPVWVRVSGAREIAVGAVVSSVCVGG